MDYKKCILNLRHQKININNDLYNMYIKYIPETKEIGAIDPRQLKVVEENMKSKPLSFQNKRHLTDPELEAIRNSFGCENIDLSQNIEMKKSTFNSVKVEIYRKKNIPNNGPIILNIHGGGFFGGCIDVVRNSCKLLADRACATVVNVDYDLSPKAKFPIALNQCNMILDYISENSEELKVDPNKIVVMGDSAGGNLAAACCLSNRNINIALQVLLYPLVELKNKDDKWSFDLYNISEKYKKAQLHLINDIKDLNEICIYSYINSEEEMQNELVSPILAKDFSRFPMTLIVSPEFDYLRLQAEKFAKKLEENGVDTIFYRYQGMGHSFYEHLGEYPQAEDCINEIAEAIMSL